MSTPLREHLNRIKLEWENDLVEYPAIERKHGLPTNVLGNKSTIKEATVGQLTTENRAAGVDIDREKTVQRDRLTPGIRITLPTISLVGGQELQIQLPRWVRQIDIQNNSDLGGNLGNVARSFDNTPAMPGDWTIRPGQTGSWTVQTQFLRLYSAQSMTINGQALGGLAIEVSA